MPARGWQPVEIACESLVGLERLELSTSRLSGVRSNHLSYRPVSAWSFLFRRRQARRHAFSRLRPSPLHQKLVELVGIEPTTSGLQSRCSPG